MKILSKNKILIILAFLSVLLAILIIKNKNEVENKKIEKKEGKSSYSSISQIKTGEIKFNFPSEEDITLVPIRESGALDSELPKEFIEEAYQKDYLRDKVPIETKGFIVDYSWEELSFIVYLKPPYEENKKKFFKWLKDNYPKISTDSFIFKQKSN